jgi:predicted permease
MNDIPWIAALRSLFRRKRVEQEMDEELKFHLECQIRDNIKEGMSPADARRTALLSFGGLEQVQEDCRDARGFRFFDEVQQDLHYAARQLLRNPGFTILAIIVLALGIGANTAVVSIIDQLVFRPIPVYQPDRLAAIAEVCSYGDYVDLRDGNKVFSGMTAIAVFGFDLWDSDHSRSYSGRAVSGNFFNVLGLKVVAGRPFLPEEDQLQGPHPVAIISYRLWQNMFELDPAAIGKTIRLNGEALTVVGVAPPRFRDIDYSGAYRDIWIPLSMFKRVMHLESEPIYSDVFEQRNKRFLTVIGRLNSGISLQEAQARMNVVSEQLRKAYPDSRRSWGTNADGSLSPNEWNILLFPITAPRRLNQNTLFSINILFVACGCILMICCANVGSLLLSRAAARQREIATRIAIGANRFRVVRQLLTEGLVLSALSLAASFAVWQLSLQCLPALEGSISESIGSLRDLELVFDPRIFSLAALIALLASLLFAVAPALLGSRIEINSTLKEQTILRGGPSPRWRRVLVIAQVILSFVLLIGAGLYIRIIARFEVMDPGFNTNVLVVNPGAPGYGFNNQKNIGYGRRVLERVRALPGVLAASWASGVPPETGRGCMQMIRTEESGSGNDSFTWVDCNAVSPGYFSTLQIPVLQGRDFTDRDDSTTADGVIIINETMARRFWPGANPLGKRLQLGKRLGDVRANPEQLYEVIGVVKDAGYSKIWDGSKPYAYFLPSQLGYADGSSILHVRVAGNPGSMLNPIRSVFESFGAEAKVRDAQPMSAEMSFMLSRERSTVFVLSLFGGLALLLASIGLYGVISYSVIQRGREFGIRLALGAQHKAIVLLVLREGVLTVLAGLIIGVPCSIALGRYLANSLHGLNPLDPITYAAIAILWVGVAILAVLVPARKAISSPMDALRVE